MIKSDIGVAPTADMLINERLIKLEDKVLKIEKRLAYLQAMIDALGEDVITDDTLPTAIAKPAAIDEMLDEVPDDMLDEMDVIETKAIEPAAIKPTADMDEVTDAIAEPGITDEISDVRVVTEETDEALIPPQEKEEIAKEIPKITPDAKRKSNELNDFKYKISFNIENIIGLYAYNFVAVAISKKIYQK